MNESHNVRLVDLPTSIRGFCFYDDDGEVYIVLNSRLSREQNIKTFDHERKHILRNDLDNKTYNEYGGK